MLVVDRQNINWKICKIICSSSTPLYQFPVYLQPLCNCVARRWATCRLRERCAGLASPRAGPLTPARSRSTCGGSAVQSSAIERAMARSWSDREGNPPCTTFIDQPFVISCSRLCWNSAHDNTSQMVLHMEDHSSNSPKTHT